MTASTLSFFEQIGVHRSIAALNKVYPDYRTTRLRLEESSPPGPSVEAARRIEDLLATSREVRLT